MHDEKSLSSPNLPLYLSYRYPATTAGGQSERGEGGIFLNRADRLRAPIAESSHLLLDRRRISATTTDLLLPPTSPLNSTFPISFLVATTVVAALRALTLTRIRLHNSRSTGHTKDYRNCRRRLKRMKFARHTPKRATRN